MVERVKIKKKVKRVRIARKDEPTRHPTPPPGIYSRATQCKHCRHWYINPCNDAKAQSCPNYYHIQLTRKKKSV